MKKTWLALLVAQLLGTALLPAAVAQTADPQPNGRDGDDKTKETLDQVTVTASKRTQFLLDVPYAVTPISADEIRDRGVRDLRDMQSTVPSLYLNQNSPGMTRIQLRGMSTLQGLPTVGTYLDEVTLDQGYAQRSIDIPLVDMQRIEVLRGPQGTLYGASSLGGTVRFITQAPKLDTTEFITEGGVRHVSGAGGQGYYATAIGNVPLSSGVSALRIVAGTEKTPGWIDNSITGQKDINDSTREYVRAKGLLRITDNVDATLMLYSAQLKQDNLDLSNSQRTVALRVPTPVNDRTAIANLVVNADLGPLSLVSSTSYLYRSLDSSVDLSALVPVPGGSTYRQDESSRSHSQEFRLNSNGNGPLSYTTGVYYRHLDSFVTATIPQVNSRSAGTQPANSQQYAVFGEGTYAILPSLLGSVGIRYFTERQLDERFTAPQASASQRFHATSPRFNLLWRYSDEGSVYTNVAKGFRSGGFNQFTDTPLTYGPETLWSYEVGNKAAFFGNRISYDAAVYYSKYRDIQGYLVSLVPLPHAIIQNTGKASGIGYDLAVSAKLMRDLVLDVAFGYNDISYDITNLDRNQGDPLNYIPKKTLGVSLTYRYNWFGLGIPGMARADYQYASAYKIIARNQAPPTYDGDATKTINLRVGVELKRWQAYLEGRNLTNNYAITAPASGAQFENARPVPRSIGISARAEF